MNKIIYIAFIILNLSFSLFASDYNLFVYNKLSDVDYYTGQSFSHFADEDILYGVDKISILEIRIKSDKRDNSKKYRFSNGKVESISSNIRDGRNSYFKYNSDGYLESVDFQRRDYLSKNECLLTEDDRIQFKISILENNVNKKIIFEQPMKNSEQYFLSQIFEYSYKNGVLDKYTKTYLNPKGTIYSKSDYSFEYSDNLLKSYSIITNNELRYKYSFVYDNENKLIEVLFTDFRDQNNNRKKVFYDFDTKGNWLSGKEYYNSVLAYEISRIITYE